MTLIRLPPSRPRRRPQELSVAADESAPLSTLLPLGLQHAAMALGLSAYVLALAKGAHFGVEETRTLLAVSIITMALGTGLQAWGGRLGSGALIVHIPGPLLVTQAAPILSVTGPGGMTVLSVACALVALLVAPLTTRLRGLFPPIVAGLVVLIGGISLIQGAITHAAGLDAAMAPDGDSLAIAAVTLGLIIGLSIWGSRRLKLFSLLIGILGGVVTALLLGRLSGGEALASVPVVALPAIVAPVFDVPVGALIAVAFVALLVQIDAIGSFILMDRMDDADWRRPDMKQAGRGILAAGIGDFLGGLLGGMATATSSANIGLCHASRATTRYAGLVAAGLLLVIAFLPQVTMALTLIPTPVIGAIELYSAAFLIAAGVDLVASRQLDTRGVFIIGLSLVCGISVLLMPGIAAQAPPSLHHLVGSGFIVTGALAITLNQLFRLGIRQSETRAISPSGPAVSHQVTDFIERMGGTWAARRDIVRRAAQAAVEAVEAIAAAGGGRRVTAIGGRFDELNFDIDLWHDGPPLPLSGAAAPDLANILDGADDEAIDTAIANVSNVLVQRLADRLKCGSDPASGRSFMRLHFDH
ncbi:MAG: purine/pyrimidine permease [Zavarzinia sp.]|nr:purine/pyrimidine permease [Zavarzinia sp.]